MVQENTQIDPFFSVGYHASGSGGMNLALRILVNEIKKESQCHMYTTVRLHNLFRMHAEQSLSSIYVRMCLVSYTQ